MPLTTGDKLENKKGLISTGKIIFTVILGMQIILCLSALFYTTGELAKRAIVFVDGKKVYYGRNICIHVFRDGAETEVDIDKGPLCLIPGDRYVSKYVTVETH
jgi:hypothetical protein